MWNWLRLVFGLPLVVPTIVDPVPDVVDVRKGIVRITMKNGRLHKLSMFGEALDFGDMVFDASERFAMWQERAGKTGMISLGGGLFKPITDVESITVEYSEHLMERK